MYLLILSFSFLWRILVELIFIWMSVLVGFLLDSDCLRTLLVENKCYQVLYSKDQIYFLIYCPYVPSPMCPYLSLSHRNHHTIIQSNRRTLWSRRQFSCTPTPAFILSTYCCSCILNAGYCWEVRGIGRSLRILRNICILWDFSFFLCFHPAPYSCGCGLCLMCSFSIEWGVR